MRSFITTAAVMLLLFAFADAQSGRRVKPTPTPEAKVEASPGDFSESVPQPKRVLPPSLIRGDNSSRNDSKASTPIPVPQSAPQEVSGDEVIKVDTDLITIP